MAVRPIDADRLKQAIEHDYYEHYTKYHDSDQTALIDMVMDDIEEMPTLTPPNELMEALEAINNAAVAYIEGGPYENDLPGMEFAVEIDRLSRDFVRPPNEWVNRMRELDELYTKLQIVTGVTAEQLLEMFSAGYVLEKPDYSKHFEAMENLEDATPPNEPLTPCDVCKFSPPSSSNGKPCCMCPAERRPPEGEEDT